jgi:hypothetical protein
MYYTIKEITALHLDILQEFPGFAGRPEKIILNGSKGFRGFTGKNPVERCQNRAVWITKESLFSDIVVMSITTFPNTNLLNAFSRNEIGNVVYHYVIKFRLEGDGPVTWAPDFFWFLRVKQKTLTFLRGFLKGRYYTMRRERFIGWGENYT